jgi:hypothetical protein
VTPSGLYDKVVSSIFMPAYYLNLRLQVNSLTDPSSKFLLNVLACVHSVLTACICRSCSGISSLCLLLAFKQPKCWEGGQLGVGHQRRKIPDAETGHFKVSCGASVRGATPLEKRRCIDYRILAALSSLDRALVSFWHSVHHLAWPSDFARKASSLRHHRLQMQDIYPKLPTWKDLGRTILNGFGSADGLFGTVNSGINLLELHGSASQLNPFSAVTPAEWTAIWALHKRIY